MELQWIQQHRRRWALGWTPAQKKIRGSAPTLVAAHTFFSTLSLLGGKKSHVSKEMFTFDIHTIAPPFDTTEPLPGLLSTDECTQFFHRWVCSPYSKIPGDIPYGIITESNQMTSATGIRSNR